MLRTLLASLKILFYALLIVFGVTFAVQNRAHVDVTFFPLPYIFELPLFIIAIFMFALGSLLGWLLAHKSVYRQNRARRQSERRVGALEDELSALRSEQGLKPAAALPRK